MSGYGNIVFIDDEINVFINGERWKYHGSDIGWSLEGTTPFQNATQLIDLGFLVALSDGVGWTSYDRGVTWEGGGATTIGGLALFQDTVFRYNRDTGTVQALDGNDWGTPVPVGLGPVNNPSMFAFDGKLWIIGGSYPAGEFGVLHYGRAYYTSDGTTWHDAEVDPLIEFKGPVVVGHGHLWTVHDNSLIASPNGVLWTEVTSAPPTRQIGYSMAWCGDELYVLGGVTDGVPDDEVLVLANSALVAANTGMKFDYLGRGSLLAGYLPVLAPGGTRPIMPYQLTTTSWRPDSEIVYTLTDVPDTGTLRLNNVPMTVGGSFTQEDISAGNLEYRDDGTASGGIEVDSFSFTVTDGFTAESTRTFEIDTIDISAPIDAIFGPQQFTDPKLEAEVRAWIGKPTGDILNTDFVGRTSLNVNSVFIVDGRIDDLNGLWWATDLRDLSFWGNRVSDLGSIASLTRLRQLDADGNSVSDLSPIRGLTNLRELGVTDTLVSDLGPLEGLLNLTRLLAWDNYPDDAFSIDNLAPLAALRKLEELALGGNSVSDLSPLARLTSLKELSLDGNNIADIAPLAGLTALERLDLDFNIISDVTALAGLTSLKTLWLWDNNIADIAPLAGLTALRVLGLGNNSITDIAALVANSGLGAGDTILLQNNPLTPQAQCLDVPTLRARGAYVGTSASCNDADGDGLNDTQEAALGTQVNNPDSDGDGISDGDEVNGTHGYVTDPTDADSDNDGVSDGVEVTTGGNPLVPDQPQGTSLGTSSHANAGTVPPNFNGQAVDTITVGGAKDGETILDVNLSLEIDHSGSGTLQVQLISPNGTVVDVITDVGQTGVPFINTALDDEALIAITAGTPPYDGTFQPQNALSAFDGENYLGDWTLVVTDSLGNTDWSLRSWNLQFVHEVEPAAPVPVAGAVGLGVIGAGLAAMAIARLRRKR